MPKFLLMKGGGGHRRCHLPHSLLPAFSGRVCLTQSWEVLHLAKTDSRNPGALWKSAYLANSNTVIKAEMQKLIWREIHKLIKEAHPEYINPEDKVASALKTACAFSLFSTRAPAFTELFLGETQPADPGRSALPSQRWALSVGIRQHEGKMEITTFQAQYPKTRGSGKMGCL